MKQIAIKQALQSDFRHRLGAVVYRGSRVLGKGFNSVGRHQGLIKTGSWPNSIHAEVAALADALRHKQDVSGADMVVVRLSKSGELRLAMPCKHCLKTLTSFGIRRILFSTDNNYLEIRL